MSPVPHLEIISTMTCPREFHKQGLSRMVLRLLNYFDSTNDGQDYDLVFFDNWSTSPLVQQNFTIPIKCFPFTRRSSLGDSPLNSFDGAINSVHRIFRRT